MMSILDTIAGAQEFATLPVVAARVLELLNSDETDLRELTVMLESDPSLTMKILQMANSPIYAVRSSVTSIQHAVMALGLNRVANIVLSVSIFSKFVMISKSRSAEYMRHFWYHSGCTGTVAKSLAKKIKKNYREIEFLGGLLHDVGKMAMIQFDPERFDSAVNARAERGISDREAEIEIFDVDHCVVGEYVGKLWRLPKQLTNIVGKHHEPWLLEEDRELTAIVRVADLFCEVWGASIYEGIEKVDLSEEKAWQTLCEGTPSLLQLDVEKFTFELETEFREANTFLSMVAGDSMQK